jgi:PAS domain S-box-containing protein
MLRLAVLGSVLLSLACGCPPASGQQPARPSKISVVIDDNYPPYIFKDSAGTLQGIIVDLWRAWEQKTGVSVEIHGMDWGEAVKRMKAGEFDVIDTAFETAERTAYLDFSKPYATLEVPIFFRSTISGVTGLDSLKGFPVAAKAGDAAVKMLEDHGVAPVLLYNNYEAIVTAALERKVNVFVVDKPPAHYFLHKLGLETEFRMSEPVSIGEFHRAVRKGNASLLELIEKGFADVGQAEFARIERRWYGQTLDRPSYLRYLGYAALTGGSVLLLVGWNWILTRLVKKRTHALLEREEQLRLYAQHSPAAIAMVDRDLKYLVVSRRWMDDYRLGDQNILGRSHYDVFPEIPKRWMEIHQRCLTGEVAKCDEEAFVRADGRTDWIRWEIQPWRQADGTIGGLIMFTEDITARKKAEALLREGETRLIKAFRCSPAALSIERMRDRVLVDVNDAFSDLSGWKREEAVGRSAVELGVLTEPESDLVRQTLVEKHTVRDMELGLKTRRGETLHVLTGMETIEFQGEPHAVSTFVDITERKRAETALARMSDDLERAQLISRIGNWEYTVTSGNIHWSDALYRIFGLEPQSITLTYARLIELIHPEDREKHDAYNEQLIAAKPGEVIEPFEYRVQRPDGELVYMLVKVEIQFDAQGRSERCFGTVQDITERKLAERRIQRLNRTYAVLSDINQMIVRERDPQMILDSTCRTAVEKGGFRMAWIGMADAEGGRLKITAHAGASADTLLKLETIVNAPAGSGCAMTAEALKSGAHALCNDIEHDPAAACWRDAALRRDYHSMTALPLRLEGRIIGTFNLYAGEAEFFDEDEMRLLDELATDVSFALEVSRREVERSDAEVRFIKQRKALIELARHQGSDGGEALVLLRKIAETAAQTLEVARVSIWRYINARSGIKCVDLFEWEEGRHSSGAELSAEGHPAYFRALAELEMIVADDAAADPSTCEFTEAYLQPHDIRSMLDVPIIVSGVRTGVLCLEHVRTLRTWTSDEKTFALAMSNLVSLALEGVERRQAEASLRESEKRFRQFAETIEEVFWMTDPTGREMIYVSPAYEKIWRRTCASLYASPRSWLEAVHAEDRERITQAVETKRTQGEYDEKYRIRRPDGTLRWIHDRAFPVRDSQGEVVRMVGTAEDITESRQVEAQLLRSQRMESIGTLAGGIAHDLNNVLAPIMMSIELLKLQEKDAQRLSMLTTIEGSAKRGADMVRQVLSFAKGMEGRQMEVQVGHLLKEIEKIANETFLKNIEVRSDIPKDLWVVQGDPTQLHQVLLNLCVNARDAMPNGGTLRLAASNVVLDEYGVASSPEAKPGPHVCIEVEDSGTGMPPEVLERIFEPFYTTKELGRGTGLGLSTTLAIIKSHHGFLRVNSEMGRGTHFHVFLPAHGAEKADVVATTAPELPRGHGELVLVVDDEAAVRQITQATLEGFGYRVLVAADGVEASTLFTTHQEDISVVLTDMMMPLMDGANTIQVLMKMNPKVRIIAASGLYAGNMSAKAASAGVKHFIPKPYTAETLLKTLDTVLRGP